MIVFTGASGHVGSAAVRHLAELGSPVAALGATRRGSGRRCPKAFRSLSPTMTTRQASSALYPGDAAPRLSRCGTAAEDRPLCNIDRPMRPLLRLHSRALAAQTPISLPLADACIAPVARDDVAAAAAEAVRRRPGTIWNLTGAISYSMAEIAAAASRASGKLHAYEPCPPRYIKRLAAELEDPWPEAFASLCASIRGGQYAATSMTVTTALSRRQEDFLERRTSASGG